MFLKANQCPVCDAPWDGDHVRCEVCGSIAEFYFGRPLPKAGSVNEEVVQKTIDRVRTYLVEHENDGVAHYTLALSYLNLGLLPEAAAALKRAAQLLPEKTDIVYEAAALAVKREDYSDEVLQQIDRILERRPEFKEAIYLKGHLFQKRGKTKATVEAWQEAYRLDPGYAAPREALELFTRANKDLLRNPQIVQSLRNSALTKKERSYLDLLNWGGKSKPRELGATSMQLLESISPAKARKMRKIHAVETREYEEIAQKRSELIQEMEADIVTLSGLCLRAQRARSQMKEATLARERASSTSVSSGALKRGTRRLSIEERSAILDQTIQNYQKQGYKLVSRTETTAQLSKQHEFSCCLAFFLVIIVIGIILYLLYYLTANKEHFVFLEVDEYGNVHASRS